MTRYGGVFMTIGERIKALRKQNGMTQENLAEYLCVSYQAVSKWECGLTNPDLSLIAPLTRLFNISADELLGITETDNDQIRKKYNYALQKYRNNEDHNSSYWWAKEAAFAYPNDYHYIEWLAFAEYQLAFDENKSDNPSSEFFNELIENSLRRYEIIIEECTDTDIYSKAVLGKIMVLRFLERIEEADWSAEFEYPDTNIKTATQALAMFEEGQNLLAYLESESK